MELNLQTGVNIVITPKAQEYLKKTNCTEISIESIEISQCCIPVVAPPEVRKGKPIKPENFLLIEKDGLAIYYQRELPKRPQVTIDLQGFGFIKLLKLVDWEIKF